MRLEETQEYMDLEYYHKRLAEMLYSVEGRWLPQDTKDPCWRSFTVTGQE